MADTQRMTFINPHNGAVSLSSFLVERKLTRSRFLALPIGKAANSLVDNPPYRSYFPPVIDLSPGVDIAVSKAFDLPTGIIRCASNFYFLDEKLTALQLVLEPTNAIYPPAQGYIEQQMLQKQLHDRVLEQELGPPPYKYEWGTVASGYDNKSVSSYIWIAYK